MPTRPTSRSPLCRLRPAAPLALLASFAIAASAAAANPATGTTSTGQELVVSVSHDAGPGPVWLGSEVSASASAALGEAKSASIVYVVDVSGSMENPGFNPFQPAVGDCDGDGLVGTALDAACVGLIALNESLGSAANVNVGLVAYGAGAKTADMDPAAGHQTFTSPPDVDHDGDGVADVEQVIRSLTTEFGDLDAPGGIGLFTPDITPGFPGATDFNAALADMNAAFGSTPADVNTGFFLSDGVSVRVATGPGTPLQAAIDAGTVVHTYGIGGGAANACDPGAALRTIADSTGGTCSEVADPSALSTVLPAALSTLASLGLDVNGVPAATAPGPDPFSLSLSNVAIGGALTIGMNTIEAVASADDGTLVTASTSLGVVDLELAPAWATSDLAEGNSHTLTATILGDASQVAGIPVAFSVHGQNAGAAGTCDPVSCLTDASGQVSFTYSVPVAPASLGTDTIVAEATIAGISRERAATKEWIGASPPVAQCEEGVNPAGHIPRAGARSPGQNEDGFYRLTASGDMGADATLYLVDGGSGAVFGPFASGTTIKYVQAPGARPGQRTGPGAVDWRINGTGDAFLYAVDGVGNVSEPAPCLVPPSPK